MSDLPQNYKDRIRAFLAESMNQPAPAGLEVRVMERLHRRRFRVVAFIGVALVLGTATAAAAGVLISHRGRVDTPPPMTSQHPVVTTTASPSPVEVPSSSPATPPAQTPPPAPVDPTAQWMPYRNAEGKFSLRYPSTWQQPSHPELCTPDVLRGAIYLGPDKDSVLVCASSYPGQMSVSSRAGDNRSEDDLTTGYVRVTRQRVTVDGVIGQRIEGTTAFHQPAGAQGTPPDGSKVVHYVFYVNGHTYLATYLQVPTGLNPSRDVLSDFDLMIMNTLRFH